MGGKGLFHPPLLPFLRGAKVDNYLARGYTANGPLCINRGTADPTDDVNINRGDAWISVTSASEGTSQVTAYTPEVEDWNQRRANATIYWVDVQWTFPPAMIASSGRPEQLTTTVTRQSDGTPLAGWLVRYEVADGGTVAGNGGGRVVEMATDAAGRATVEVSPTAAGAANSRIGMQLIRPAGFSGGDAPRLIVGQGSTVVQWTGASQPYLPADTPSSPTTPNTGWPVTPAPSRPNTPGTPPPTAGVRVEAEIQGGAQQANVGDRVPYTIVLRNIGTAAITGGKIVVQFDDGLLQEFDSQGTRRIESPQEGQTLTLGAGETRNLPLTFDVVKPGRQCVQLTVTYNEGPPINKEACVAAAAAAEQRQPRLEVTVAGPAAAEKGKTAVFNTSVRNTGQLPLVNIDLYEEYPPAQLHIQSIDPRVQINDGTIHRVIPRLEVGQVKEFETECLCIQETARCTVIARTVAQSDPPTVQIIPADEHVFRINPVGAAVAPGLGPGGVFPPAAGARPGLSTKINFSQATVQAGARVTCEITVTNLSTVADRNVKLEVGFLQDQPKVAPDVTRPELPAGVTANLQGDLLTFSAIPVLGPGETATFRFPINANEPGIVSLRAKAASDSLATPVVEERDLEIARRGI